jgi:tetratricopeptide (TPR) repeat protein
MMQMKRTFLLAIVAFIGTALTAQTLEEGKKFLYYERYNSAREVFEKLLAAKPTDADAAYWLGQAYLGLENVSLARQTYQAALQTNGNNPLLLTGMGQVELMENKAVDARNRFETALSLTKSKNLDVLHAVARANVYSKGGDPSYAISKLQLATALKGFKDAFVYVTMGDAYRKMVDGGNAVLAYKQALMLDPVLAAARHKEGQIYETQKNREYFLPAFEEAVQMDPKYAPAYYSLYVFWYYRDVVKAEDYLNKYISVIDTDPQNDYFRIDLKYASKQFQQAINESDALIAKVGANVIKPRIYRLKAYSYKSLSDFVNARKSADEFFQKAQPGDIVPKDYELYGDILAGIPGLETQAYSYYDRAMTMDTSADNKAAYLQKAADLAKTLKDKPGMADWLAKQYNTKKNPSNVDLYNLGRAFFDAGDNNFGYYAKADSIFAIYTSKYPTQAYGYYWRARSNWGIDTNMMNSLANPHFEKFIEVATTGPDSVTFRPQVKVAYKYFVGYNIFVKKDYKTAIDFCDKILAIDPNDREAQEYKRQLTGGKQSPAPGTKPAGNKPAGTGAGVK